MRGRGAVLMPFVALLLAGCTSSPVGAAVPPSTDVPTAALPSPASTPTTPPPTQDASDATPVDRRCAALVPKSVARTLSPDLAVERGWVAEEGTPVGRLEALDGTTCAWTDAAGNRLEVAVAKPSAKDARALKNDLVDRSNSVPTYGGEAYFQVADLAGEVDAFRGRTWIVARSNLFYEPGDAVSVLAAVDEGLGLASNASDASTPAPTPTLEVTLQPTG